MNDENKDEDSLLAIGELSKSLPEKNPPETIKVETPQEETPLEPIPEVTSKTTPDYNYKKGFKYALNKNYVHIIIIIGLLFLSIFDTIGFNLLVPNLNGISFSLIGFVAFWVMIIYSIWIVLLFIRDFAKGIGM